MYIEEELTRKKIFTSRAVSIQGGTGATSFADTLRQSSNTVVSDGLKGFFFHDYQAAGTNFATLRN